MNAKLAAAAAALLIALTAASAALGRSHPTVRLAKTSLGKILVSRTGRTLYMFSRDGRSKDRCVQIAGCAGVWPLLTTAGKPLAGPGARASLLGTIKVPGRAQRQVTYAGHPLYTYSGDTGPGQTFYVGVSQFGGVWPALNATGHKVG